MATTISFPTAVSDHSSTNASNAFADDGRLTDNIHATDDPITWSSFSSLSIPAEATIDGIEIIVEAQGKTNANLPKFKVYNGTSWSGNLGFNSTLGRSLTVYDPGWGASNYLWGLTWNATTAAGIQIQVDNGTIGTGASWRCDYLKVRVTYTAAAAAVMLKVNGVTDGNIAEVDGVTNANMAKINGITDTD